MSRPRKRPENDARYFDAGCLPVLRDHPRVLGVYVGCCVETGRRFRHKAHAHTDGEYVGWICYLSRKWLHVPEVALHELAHVLTECGHTDRWRAKVLEIGGTLDPVPGILRSYHKVSRVAASRGLVSP